MVRAKFKLVSYTTALSARRKADAVAGDHSTSSYETIEVRTLRFQPVCDGSEENKRFFASTPSGQLELQTLNQEAWSQFKLNEEYYLDFSAVPVAPA